VKFAVPLLVTMYPVAICPTILTQMDGVVAHRAIYAGAVIGALSTSIFEVLAAAGTPIAFANTAISYIPLGNAGFAWIVPGAVGAIVGFVLSKIGFGSPIPSIVEQVGESGESAVAAG
jgi:LIVCS family branched-chain amino acid:cation transporter